MERKFYLVDSEVLPKVFAQVLEAKENLSTGKAKNISQAAKMAGISRSALYKYKDSIFSVNSAASSFTLLLRLRDEPGVLQRVLQVIASAGANIVTINQSIPKDRVADVSVTYRAGTGQKKVEVLVEELRLLPGVVEVHRSLEGV